MRKKSSLIKDLSKGLLGAVLFLCFFFVFSALIFGADRATSLSDTYGACCRVFNGGTAGSGTCFYQDKEGNCYILTNYHVAGSNDCKVEFFDTKGEPVRVSAVNVWRAYSDAKSLDCSVLKVDSSEAGCITKFIPFYTKDFKGENTCIMSTTGAPRAQWLRWVKGQIRCDDSGGNWTFRPTPFGGQSGSSIVALKNNKPYIVALLTWRTLSEGSDDWGGLAQPISRVLTAMSGTVAELPNVPRCSECIDCPSSPSEPIIKKQKKSGGAIEPEPVFTGGQWVIPVAETVGPVSVELWTIQGCSPCATAKKYGVPSWSNFGRVVIRDASGSDRFNAQALGISEFPTIRIIDKGGDVVKKYVGYNTAIDGQVLATLKKYNVKPKAVGEDLKDTGRFGIFGDMLDNNDSEEPETEKAEEPKESEPSAPLFQPPKGGAGLLGNKLGDNLKAELQNGLGEFFADLLNQYSSAVKYWIFWLTFLACTLALLSFQAVKTVLKAVYACFKWAFKKLVGVVKGLGNKSLQAIAKAVTDKQAEDKEGGK